MDKQVECSYCGGEGEVEFDKPVVDWKHGGYIDSEMGECPECDGYGCVWVEVDDEE